MKCKKCLCDYSVENGIKQLPKRLKNLCGLCFITDQSVFTKGVRFSSDGKEIFIDSIYINTIDEL